MEQVKRQQISIKRTSEVDLSSLSYTNPLQITKGDMYVTVSYDFCRVIVYYWSTNKLFCGCCVQAPGKYKDAKTAQTQIKKFFNKYC